MKFNVKTSELKKVLSAVQKVVKDKCAITAAENVLVSVQDDILSILGTNLECSVLATVPVSDREDGGTGAKILVNPRYISELLKEYSGEVISFETKGNNGIICRFGEGEYRLTSQDGGEFPEPAGLKNPYSVTVDTAELIEGLSQTMCMCDDNGGQRPALEGVLFDIKADGLTLVASDSKRLVCRNVSLCGTLVEEEAQLILHAKAVTVLKSVLDKKEAEQVTLSYDGKNLSVSAAGQLFTSKLVNAKFPNYAQVFPKDNEISITFGREALINLTRRVSVCSSKTNKFIHLTFSNDKMTVASEDVNFKVSAKETVKCDYKGENLTVGLQSENFSSILQAITSDDVRIDFNSNPKKPVLISPTGERAEAFRSLLMPVAV